MDIIQQIVAKAIVEIYNTIEETGLSDIGKTIKSLRPTADRMILDLIANLAEEMDNALVEAAKGQRRRDGIRIKEKGVERTLVTECGELRYKRTYFSMPDGEYAYILDHIIGIEAYERFSKDLIAEVLNLSTSMSFQKAAEATGQSMSRQTVHNRLIALDDVTVEVERVKDTPEVLDLFADEDHAHLTPKGSAVIPLVTITEGMDESNSKRHRTIHPIHVSGYGMTADAYRENVLAVLTERYDLDKVKQINIHADGGSWIKGLQQTIMNSRLVMDGYHLGKELRSFFRTEGVWRYACVIRKSIKEDRYEDFEKYCSRIYDGLKDSREQEKVREFVSYIAKNWAAIVNRMKGETCGSCTEPLVSHVLSERLSRDPISWSKDGLSRMAMLVVNEKNGRPLRNGDVRIRKDDEARKSFREDGYALYQAYAEKQADDVLHAKLDWSLLEKTTFHSGKVNGTYMLLKSMGSLKSLSDFAS